MFRPLKVGFFFLGIGLLELQQLRIRFINIRIPLLGMLETIPRLAGSRPVEDAGVLQGHVLPLVDCLHLDIPRQWQMLKVLPNGKGQRGLTSHSPISVLSVLERQLTNLFRQALRPPTIEVDKVHTGIEGGFDAPVGDGIAVLVLLVQALGLSLDGDGGNGRAVVVVAAVQHTSGHLHNVAFHDRVAVDPHGLLDMWKEIIHDESDVVGQIAVEVDVLSLRLVPRVCVDKILELVLVLELVDGIEPDVGHALERFFANEVEDDMTGRMGLDGTDTGFGAYDGLSVRGVDQVYCFLFVEAVFPSILHGPACFGRKMAEGTCRIHSDYFPIVVVSAGRSR